MICQVIFYCILININIQIVYSITDFVNEDSLFTNDSLYISCPKQIFSLKQGRQNVKQSNLFYSKINKFYFDVSLETDPDQMTITQWKESGKVEQILTGVINCNHVTFDQDHDSILMICKSSSANLIQFQSGSFVLSNEFQNLNTVQVTSLQIIPDKSSTSVKFATMSFLESQLKFWSSDKTSPTKIIQLHLPNNPDNLPIAYEYIFIPNTNLICVFDVTKYYLRLFDIETGEQFNNSSKLIRIIFPPINKFIQYNNNLNLVFIFHVIRGYPLEQQISTYYANNLTLFTSFNIEYEKENNDKVTCMYVIQDTQFVAFGHNDGKITIYNIITTELIRKIKVSENAVIDIFIYENTMSVIAYDENKVTIFKQYDWKNNYFVEQSLTNQDQCVSTCDNKQNKISDWLACRACIPAYKCATCNSQGCVSCNPGLYLDSTILPSGLTQKKCVLYCSQQLFGKSFQKFKPQIYLIYDYTIQGLISDNNQQTKCSEICPQDEYDIENRLCSSSTSKQSSNQFNSINASIILSQQSKDDILVVFERQILFNRAHILQNQQIVQQMNQCVIVEINRLKSSDFTYQVTLDPEKNTYLSISINLLQKVGIKDPKINIKFEGQTCFKDTNYVPLNIKLVKEGLNIDLPWNIINYDEEIKIASENLGQVTQGVSDTVAAAAFPLYLTNVMYIFWVLINVFQHVNFLLYLNVKYPVNVVTFFRAFKSFNLNFLSSFQIDFNSKTQEYTFMNKPIIDQTPPMPFQREGMTSSFYLNGLKFLLTFLVLYIALYIIRIISRSMKINCRVVKEDSGIIHKFIAIAQQKIEYTMIITTHQSSMLQFSVAIFLQLMGFSSENVINVFGFLISILGFFYLSSFLKQCYQKVNLNEMIVGSKITDKLQDENLKQKYNLFKMQYGILYQNVNFIFYVRRNYHVLVMLKQVIISFVVVVLNKFTFVCLLIFIIIHFLNSIFLILFRPFDRKLIGYLIALNEFCMTIILCLIFYIHVVNESSGSIITEDEIYKVLNIGWVIITFLLILFLVNTVSGIVFEWDSIKETFYKLRQKIKDLTKSNTIEFKDSEENLGFNSNKVIQFQLFNNEEKRNNQFADLMKNKSNQTSSSDSDTPQGKNNVCSESKQNIDISQASIKQSLISNLDSKPIKKILKKKNPSNPNKNQIVQNVQSDNKQKEQNS